MEIQPQLSNGNPIFSPKPAGSLTSLFPFRSPSIVSPSLIPSSCFHVTKIHHLGCFSHRCPIPSATSHPWYQLIVTCYTLSAGLQFLVSGLSLASKTQSSGHVCYCSMYSGVTHSQWTEAPPALLVLPQADVTVLLHSLIPTSPPLRSITSHSSHTSLLLSAPGDWASAPGFACAGLRSPVSTFVPGRASLSLGNLQECCLFSPDSTSHLLSSSWPGASWGPVTWFWTLTHWLGHCCYCSVRSHEPAVLCRQNHFHVGLPSLCLPTFRTGFHSSTTFPRTWKSLTVKVHYGWFEGFSLTTKDICKRQRNEKLSYTGCFRGSNQCGGTHITTGMT